MTFIDDKGNLVVVNLSVVRDRDVSGWTTGERTRIYREIAWRRIWRDK